jgi:hypothetical protein
MSELATTTLDTFDVPWADIKAFWFDPDHNQELMSMLRSSVKRVRALYGQPSRRLRIPLLWVDYLRLEAKVPSLGLSWRIEGDPSEPSLKGAYVHSRNLNAEFYPQRQEMGS